MRDDLVAGIFVAGASSRMGGSPKGLLTVDGVALVDRWRSLFDRLGIPSLLVGAHAAYAPRPAIADEIADVGPLGGLVALLRHAGERRAIVVACDMPRVSLALLQRLVTASTTGAIAVAPRRGGRWEAMFAAYAAGRALDVARRRAGEGELSLQGLLEELDATDLVLSDEEAAELDDWDAPEDIPTDPTPR